MEMRISGYASGKSRQAQQMYRFILDQGHRIMVVKGQYYEIHKKYGHLVCITTKPYATVLNRV